jgi:hypothetical protein
MSKPKLRAIMVCVDYGDLLRITLPYNRHHFSAVMIVTTSRDSETIDVAKRYGAGLYFTEAFYDNRAYFNKWKALEQGLDAFGRFGWLCIMDADVLWPKMIEHPEYECGYLYTPRRRIQNDILNSPLPEVGWPLLPLYNECEFAGYTQIFHADDSHLSVPPWYEQDWRHAGGGDSFFQYRWPVSNKRRPAWQVLHLGAPQRNWCGRVTMRTDGATDPAARQRAHWLEQLLRARKRHSFNDPYHAERLPH